MLRPKSKSKLFWTAVFSLNKKSPVNLRTDGAARRDKLLEKEKWFKALYIQSCGSRRNS